MNTMEIGVTNVVCLSSEAVSENATENSENRHQKPASSAEAVSSDPVDTSVAKCFLKWRKYVVLILTPIVLAPLPIAVPTSVSAWIWLLFFFCMGKGQLCQTHQIQPKKDHNVTRRCTCCLIYGCFYKSVLSLSWTPLASRDSYDPAIVHDACDIQDWVWSYLLDILRKRRE